MDNISDLKISGVGRMGGGKYRDVKISGKGEIDGDIEAQTVQISGMGKVNGKTVAGRISVSGMGTMSGGVECKSISNSGSLTIEGPLNADEIRVSGSMTVKEGVKSRYIRCSGFLNSGAGIEAEEFRSRGEFKIKGLLNANDVDIIFGWHSFANEIGGEEIRIRHSHYMFPFILSFFGKIDRLEADLIEGNNIMVEYAEVKTIRGNNILIGDYCRVDLVEYSGKLGISPKAIVKNRVKV